MSENGDLRCSLRLVWSELGSVRLDDDRKIMFPRAPACGGLYRIVLKRLDQSTAVYVGETDNIRRRFAHYRNPGPTQATNLRMNALIVDILDGGGAANLEVVVDKAWVGTDGSERIADFTRKEVRRLFENLTLAIGHALDIESLNR